MAYRIAKKRRYTFTRFIKRYQLSIIYIKGGFFLKKRVPYGHKLVKISENFPYDVC